MSIVYTVMTNGYFKINMRFTTNAKSYINNLFMPVVILILRYRNPVLGPISAQISDSETRFISLKKSNKSSQKPLFKKNPPFTL